jgi:hypothetical protein
MKNDKGIWECVKKLYNNRELGGIDIVEKLRNLFKTEFFEDINEIVKKLKSYTCDCGDGINLEFLSDCEEILIRDLGFTEGDLTKEINMLRVITIKRFNEIRIENMDDFKELRERIGILERVEEHFKSHIGKTEELLLKLYEKLYDYSGNRISLTAFRGFLIQTKINDLKPYSEEVKGIAHCTKIINKNNYEICGKDKYKSRFTEINGIQYRIDLCEVHYNEFNDLENENK